MTTLNNYYLTVTNVSYVKEGEAVLLPVGEPVILTCNFPAKVNCSWSRRGYELEVIRQYSYLDTGHDGRRTSNCSLRISDFQDIDVGQWQCSGKVISTKERIVKTEMDLQLGKPRTQTLIHNFRC